MQDSFRRLSKELAKVEQGHLKAFADKGKVIFMIQDAPEGLRQLAAALERVNISEIQAVVGYQVPVQEPEPGAGPGGSPKGRAKGRARKK
ncbi:hypothetical protein ACFL59_07510 [Planctomycetota bacterium]